MWHNVILKVKLLWILPKNDYLIFFVKVHFDVYDKWADEELMPNNTEAVMDMAQNITDMNADDIAAVVIATWIKVPPSKHEYYELKEVYLHFHFCVR